MRQIVHITAACLATFWVFMYLTAGSWWWMNFGDASFYEVFKVFCWQSMAVAN